MKQRILLAALALSLCISIGIGMAADFSYQSYTDRPGNFVMNDVATTSGFNSFQASSFANAGGVDEFTKVTPLPVDMKLGAPDEKSFQQITMDFCKDGTTVDPAVQETVQSDITVGAVSNAVVPTFDTNGNLVTSKMGEGYDIATLEVGGVAGTPILDNNNKLTGITDDYQRYVFSGVQSYQDDYITATGADSAGTLGTDLTSFTTASVGSPTMPEGTPYVKFNWNDMRGYAVDTNNVAWSGAAQWTIQNSVNFQQILPSDYRTGIYL